MQKILGMGNALTDILLKINNDLILHDLNLPKGSMQLIDDSKISLLAAQLDFSNAVKAAGGSASNTVTGISRLGGKAGYFGSIGKDETGIFFKNDLINNGVVPHLAYRDNISGTCTVLISEDGERTMCTYLGAACEIDPDDIRPDLFHGYDFLHIEGYLVFNHDLILKAVKLAKEAGLTVSIDMASFNIVEANLDFLKEITANYVDIIFANEEEAMAFSGMPPGDALIHMDDYCNIAVVKLGKDGSMIRTEKKNLFIEPFVVDCADTTGAGDLYAAAFLYGLASGYELNKCGKIASYVSSKVVEVIGAKMKDEVWHEINERIKSFE